MTSSDRVVILDQVELPAEVTEAWLSRWRADYLPAALDRELRLQGLWTGWTEDPGRQVVVACWSLPRVGRYWSARWQATDDDAVTAFWQWSDSIAHSRTRQVLQNVTDEIGVAP